MPDISKQINDLLTDPDFLRLGSFRNRPNLFETVAASHTEMWHSAFVKWLLDPNSHLGLGDFPLKRFLFAVLEFGTVEADARKPDLAMGSLENMDLSSMIFETEFKRDGLRTSMGGKASIDIYGVSEEVRYGSANGGDSAGEGALRLVVENKVKAREGKDQTDTYFRWAQRSTSNFKYDFFVFLTPDESQTPGCDRFVQITYQHLCDAVLVPCLRHPNLPEESRYMLEQYHANLGRPLGGGRVMALPNKELCQRIYDAHEEVLNEIFVSVKGEAPRSNPRGAKIRRSSLTLDDLVQGGLLDLSDSLQATYRGNPHAAELERQPSGVVISLNGTRYESPSSAASAITGKPVNGWTFWSAQNKGTLSALRQRLQDQQGDDAEKEDVL